MPEISIIVPVYKVEEYISACVNSILNQTFKDFELILIDDGSPDNCGKICDDFVRKDVRVRVIHQENQGLSGARNAGMDNATGKYITFVDSDDIVSENFLLELYTAIVVEQADMAVCMSCDLSESEILNYSAFENKGKAKCYFLDRRTSIIGLYDGTVPSSIGSTCKLYVREKIDKIRFPVGRLHEDQAFTPVAFYCAERIVYIDSNIYFYRIREESITHKSFKEKRYDDLWAIDKCIGFFREKGEQEIVEAALRRRQRILCTYAVYAKRDGVEVPEPYRISLFQALRYLRKHVSVDKYQYCLSQVYPKLVIWDAYARKLESLFCHKKEM